MPFYIPDLRSRSVFRLLFFDFFLIFDFLIVRDGFKNSTVIQTAVQHWHVWIGGQSASAETALLSEVSRIRDGVWGLCLSFW